MLPIMPLSCVLNVKNVKAFWEWLKYWLFFVWHKFGFEKSHGNRNFGFDLLDSVSVFKNRNRTEIWFPHIPWNNTKKHEDKEMPQTSESFPRCLEGSERLAVCGSCLTIHVTAVSHKYCGRGWRCRYVCSTLLVPRCGRRRRLLPTSSFRTFLSFPRQFFVFVWRRLGQKRDIQPGTVHW